MEMSDEFLGSEEFTSPVVPLDEQDLSISDMKSVDYFSIDLNNGGDDMSDCSSVSLPSIIDGNNKRKFYRQQIVKEGDHYVVYEEEIVELNSDWMLPSSHVEPVYNSSDDELSFVTYEEESYYTYTSINASHSHRMMRSINSMRSFNSSDNMMAKMSDHSHSRRSRSRRSRKSLKSSNHSAGRSKRSRRTPKAPKDVVGSHHHSPGGTRDRRTGQRKTAPRMVHLKDQVNTITSAQHKVDDSEHDEDDVFTLKSLDLDSRPLFGPSAEMLLKQRQAGSRRDILKLSGHTTDAIVGPNHQEDGSSEDKSFEEEKEAEHMAFHNSINSGACFSFYEEETLEGSDTEVEEIVPLCKMDVSQLPSSLLSRTSANTAMTERIRNISEPKHLPAPLVATDSGYSVNTNFANNNCRSDHDSSTQSISESVDDENVVVDDDDDTDTMPLRAPTRQDSVLVNPLVDIMATPKVDLTSRTARARRLRNEVLSSKLTQLEQRINSLYGASTMNHKMTRTPNADTTAGSDALPVNKRGSRPSLGMVQKRISTIEQKTDAAATQKNAYFLSPVLLQKRKEAEQKRQKLRLAFNALQSPTLRTSNSSKGKNGDELSNSIRQTMEGMQLSGL